MDIKEYISVREFAEYSNVSTQTVYNMIRDNIIEAVRFNRNSRTGYLVEKPIGYNESVNK